MPTKSVRPANQSFEGEKVYQILEKSMYDKILTVSKEVNVTPYMIMLCAYYILLEKYTGKEGKIIYGSRII